MKNPNLFGVEIDPVTLEEILWMIQTFISKDQRALISHVNIRGLNLAFENPWLLEFYANSDLVYCDGMGVQLGAKLLGQQLPQRLTLADWIWPLGELAERCNYSMFFLGSPPGTAAKAASNLHDRYPDLDIKGTHHGFFDKSRGHPENYAVLEILEAAKPDILLVGFGMPIQEKWLFENWESLKVNVAMTVGGLFEYVAGGLKRGPSWMTQNYLEWLVRVFVAPDRYFFRYLRDIPLFTWRILKQKLFGSPHSNLSKSDNRV